MNILPLPNGDFTTEEWVNNNGPLTVTVHSFRMGDVEDPDLYAGEPLWKWQNSEMGEWVMANAVQTPSWHRHIDPSSFGWTYTVRAELSPKDYTFWWFKWGHELTKK
jgi:hypothetical protein